MAQYFPILKTKQAEWKALANISSSAGKFAPILEVTPAPESRKQRPTDAAWVQEIIDEMEPALQGRAAFVDPTLMNQSGPTHKSDIVFTALTQASSRVAAGPVLRLNSAAGVRDSARVLANRNGAGAVIRISEDELSSMPLDGGEAANRQISAVVESLRIPQSNVTLLLDLGALNTEVSYSLYVNSLLTSIPTIDGLGDFGAIVIAGSSAPAQNDVAGFAEVSIARTEWEIYLSLIARASPGVSYGFGDYVGFAPALPPGQGRAKHPALRYTRDSDAIIMRRQSMPGAGMASFADICKYVQAQPWYSGAEFSWGDLQIDEIRNELAKAAGGGSKGWRSISVNHHIMLVSRQLANLLGA